MARGHGRSSRNRQDATNEARRKAAPTSTARSGDRAGLATHALAVTGAAVSALTPAHAITLGDVTIESALGEPLSARVPVELAPGELLGAACVSAPAGTSDLLRLPQARVSVPETAAPGRFALHVTTAQPLYEPMYELQLQVRCPGVALLVRQYVLMLDLPGAPRPQVTEPVAAAAPAVPSAMPGTAAPAGRERPVRPRVAAPLGAPIGAGISYRVAEGDTLSTIAARVSGRDVGIWTLADRIFAANPGAFIDANPDLIKLGSEISIPAPGDASVAVPAAAVAAPAAPAAVEVPPAATQPAPEPPAEAVAASEPATPVSVAAPTVEAPATAVVPEPPAEVVFEDERAPVESLPTQPPAAVATEASDDTVAGGTPAWLAALIGLLVGGIASAVMLRQRLLEALRNLLPRRKPLISPMVERPAEQRAAQRRMLPAESTMVVVEGPVHEAPPSQPAARPQPPAAPAPAPAPAVTPAPALVEDASSDLAELFADHGGATDHAIVGLSASADALDLDLSAAAPDVTVDQDIGWLGDETALSPTQELAAGNAETVEHIDLQTLSERATDDAQISQTLRDALNLLESDYEDELTASQVIDRAKLQQVLDENGEDTLVRTGTDRHRRH
jgi:hypothetical protein